MPPPLFSSTRFLFSSQQYHGSYLGLTHTSHQYLASTQSDHWVIPRISGHRERERKKVHYLQSIPPWAVTRLRGRQLVSRSSVAFLPFPQVIRDHLRIATQNQLPRFLLLSLLPFTGHKPSFTSTLERSPSPPPTPLYRPSILCILGVQDSLGRRNQPQGRRSSQPAATAPTSSPGKDGT